MVRLRGEGSRRQCIVAGVLLCCIYSFFDLPLIIVGHDLFSSYYLYLMNKETQ